MLSRTARPGLLQDGSCHRHLGRSEDFCPLGSGSCGQNRSCSCLKVLGTPPLPAHPAEPELPSEMSARGSNPWLVSFYKEIKHTDGSSILYLKGRKRILRAGAGSQQTRSDAGNGGANKAGPGSPGPSRAGGQAEPRESSALMCRSIPGAPLGPGQAADSTDPGGGLQGGPG